MTDEKKKREALTRSEKFSRDRNVKALTIFAGDPRRAVARRITHLLHEEVGGGRAERMMQEYYLRRHWATAVLHDLQHMLGMSWLDIHENTGRSRAQWLNVTTCKRPDAEYFIKRCEPFSFSVAGKDMDAARKKRGRPQTFRDPEVHTVSRSFIYDVCNNLKKNYSLKTVEFRMAWEQGLMVFDLSSEEAWKKQMENFGLKTVDMEEQFVTQQLKRGVIPTVTLWTESETTHEPHRVNQEPFPLVRPDLAIFSRGHDEQVDKYMRQFESWRWGAEDRKEGLYNQKCIDDELKAVEQEAARVDPVNFAPPTPVPTDSPDDILKKDDGSYPLADLGHQQITIPLDVHPKMVDENGDVTFTVKLKFLDGVKVGHSVEFVPVPKANPSNNSTWVEGQP